ncbi:integrase core domain-containing protein [Desulfovibrio desulfuricans]|uniref:integrase core domain-containing protein n=1 Tax=Desulfovibrio desulfuricans TaxID=876 RepID=UPI00398AE976
MESFNGKFRDECLNQNVFLSLHDARKTVEAWRQVQLTATAQFLRLADTGRISRKEYNLQPIGNK